MKCGVARKELLNVVRVVSQVRNKRSAWPILRQIRFRTAGTEKLRVSAFDLGLGIECVMPAEVSEEGECSFLGEMVKYQLAQGMGESVELARAEEDRVLPSPAGDREAACLIMDGNTMRARQFDSDEFRDMPDVNPIRRLTMKGEDLAGGLRRTSFASSPDELRAIMCGVCLRVRQGLVTLVATDTHRLAVEDIREVGPVGPAGLVGPDGMIDEKVIMPRETVCALVKVLGDGEEVAISIGEATIEFRVGEWRIVSRLIEGIFPTYERAFLSDDPVARVTMPRAAFLRALRRVAWVAKCNAGRVLCQAASGSLKLSASADDFESAEKVLCDTEASMEMGFNVQYLLDALIAISAEKVTFDLWGERSIGRITSEELPGWQYLVMPMEIM